MTRILMLLFCLSGCLLNAQSPYILPDTKSNEIADRWDILYDFDKPYHLTNRNISRKNLVEMGSAILSSEKTNQADIDDVLYIFAENNEYLSGIESSSNVQRENNKVYDSAGVFYYLEGESNDIEKTIRYAGDRQPVLKHFFKTKANFFEVNSENFSLRVNPIVNVNFGSAVDDENVIFQNTRGAEIRGMIDEKIYFYTSILENQRGFNNYLEARIDQFDALPQQGFYKTFQSTVSENISGYDYLNAQAYVGINATKSLAIEFGHGKHFIGNGIRSLFLSDYGHNYFYLKFNTRIWKFNYQNIFAELAPISSVQNPLDRLLPKKYMANHYLSFQPNENLEFGLFEAVVFSRQNQFEFQYLNPIILYRTVEQFLDSPDNALIGLSGKWNVKNRFQLYGQLILDEFKISELTAGDGWWGNKYGVQIGAKYINVLGVDHLDAQVEYNRVRPFTYAHRDSLDNFPDLANASYSHFNQALAHPLGANFTELTADIKYRPTPRLSFRGRAIAATYGQDLEGEHNGGNILQRNGLRDREYDHNIGQGVTTNLLSLSLDVSYEFFHNYFFDLNLLYRTADADLEQFNLDTRYFGGGIRANIGHLRLDY